METEIYNIIKKIVYEQSIKKLYDNAAENFEYPIKIEKITFDVLDIFNSNYFDKYKICLIHNAAIYAIRNEDIKYINLFNKKNIQELISRDKIVRAMITQRAFYNINTKLKYNKNYDNETKENSLELYNKLTKIYSLEVITKKIRKIILGFLNNYDNSNFEIILDALLTTNKLDEEIIKYDNFLNVTNLNEYKSLLFRIILSDNYIYLKSLEKDTQAEIEDNLDDEIDEEEEFVEYIDEQIIELLESYNLSKLSDYGIRLNLYSNFIIYNTLLSEQKADYENIKNDKKAIKTLKKINILFFLDLF